MQAPVMSFYEWQERYASEEACAVQIAELRWPEGFRCPHCGDEHGWYCGTRRLYECASCHRQTSITAGTLFHGSRVPLRKWFWALYWVSTDKGSISGIM